MIPLEAVGAMLIWVLAALVLLLVGHVAAAAVSTRIEEGREIFERDNVAVAVAAAGLLIGQGLIINSAIRHNDTIPQMFLWGAIGLVVKLAAYALFDLITPKWKLTANLREGKVATGIFVGTLFAVLGGIVGAGIA